MKRHRPSRAPKVPPRTVVVLHFEDGTTFVLPSAEDLVLGIEKNALVRHAIQCEPVNVESRKAQAACKAIRVRHVAEVQQLIDAAVQVKRMRAKAGEAGAEVRAKAGDQTRANFHAAVNAALSSGLGSQKLTAGVVAAHWPRNSTQPGRSRLGELLRAWKAAHSGDQAEP